MKSVNFTAERINRLQCESGKRQSFFRDGKTPGLGLRVTAAGVKTYVFETRMHNVTMRLTIGDTRTWTVGRAQDEATRLKTLTDQGIDPRKLRREQLAAEALARIKDANALVTVRQAWNEYVDAQKSEWGPHHLAQHITFVQLGGEKWKRGTARKAPGVLSRLTELRLGEVTAEKLVDWLVAESATRATSTRQSFAMFRAFWHWCAKHKSYKPVIDAIVIDDELVRRKVPDAKTKKFDVLQRSQMAPWFKAVRGLSNQVASVYLQTLVLTGARREEIGELKWTDVDLTWTSLLIKDKIDAQGRKIPLPPYLFSLISALPRRNKWVFSSRKSKSGRLVEPIGLHRRALKAAQLQHVSIHGLRRTFASLAEWVEMPKGIIAQIMGHAPKATAEKHYIDRPLELLALWHNKYEAWILQEAGVAFGEPKPTEHPVAKKSSGHLRLVANG